MTAPERPTPPLLPCPFCGSRAVFGEITDPEDEGNFGGHFITCTGCVATTDLRFACGDDPEPLLAEAWNRRVAAQRAAEAVDRCSDRGRERLGPGYAISHEPDCPSRDTQTTREATPPPGDAGERARFIADVRDWHRIAGKRNEPMSAGFETVDALLAEIDALQSERTAAAPQARRETLSSRSEDFAAALECAHSQYENYVRQGQLGTEALRLAALRDALSHAVGVLRLRALATPQESA